MKMWLMAVLSGFLLFTAAIVSNIESGLRTKTLQPVKLAQRFL
jgi:hypothetical protein